MENLINLVKAIILTVVYAIQDRHECLSYVFRHLKAEPCPVLA
jgi:hypothetical protein